MPIRVAHSFLALLVAIAWAGCARAPDAEPENGSKIEVNPPFHIIDVDTSMQAVGDVKHLMFTVSNPGKGDEMCISEIWLDYGPATDEETEDKDGPAFQVRLGPPDGDEVDPPTEEDPICLAPKGEHWDMMPETLDIDVMFKRYDDRMPREARLLIVNDNDDDEDLQGYEIKFQMRRCGPELPVPEDLKVEGTAPGAPVIEPAPMPPDGASCSLVPQGFTLGGDASFWVPYGLPSLKNPAVAGKAPRGKKLVRHAPAPGKTHKAAPRPGRKHPRPHRHKGPDRG